MLIINCKIVFFTKCGAMPISEWFVMSKSILIGLGNIIKAIGR